MEQETRVKQEFKVMVEVTVTEQMVEDLLCCAFEGGSNYWYMIDSFNYPEGATQKSLGIEFPQLELPFRGGSLTISDIEDGDTKKTLDIKAIENGLKLLATKYPSQWQAFISENHDGDTGDVFLQLCLFGEVVFG